MITLGKGPVGSGKNSPAPPDDLIWSMRFLHVADVHLDTSFSGRSERVRQRLRDASREAFRNAVDLAIHEDVHAFLIAGDLFDGERLSFQTERFLLEQTERLGDHGITVVYATGNHDPGAPTTGPRSLAWSDAVQVAPDGTPRRFTIHDHGDVPIGYVTAVGHDTDRVTDDLSRSLPVPAGELPEIALLHTQVHTSLGARDHHSYAPSELTRLCHAGYDYWALGHVHIRQQLSADPPIWYPGSLQGKSHTDTGARGALLVDLSDRAAPLVSFRPLAPVRWDTIEVDRLDHVQSLDDLEYACLDAWNQQRAEDPTIHGTEWMVRVVLRGPCPLWAELRTVEDQETLASELAPMMGALEVVLSTEGVHATVDLDEHRKRTDVLGEALRLATEIHQGRLTLEDLDPTSLAGSVGDDPASIAEYARSLLGEAEGEGELAMRLLNTEARR